MLGRFLHIYLPPRNFLWENDPNTTNGTPENPGSFYHDAIHDIESFMWILIELALTRKGPGLNMRRQELQPVAEGKPTKGAELKAVIVNLFEQEHAKELGNAKAEYIANPGLFAGVIAHFHPYFKPLGPPLQRLLQTMTVAYTYRAYEYHHIHEYAITIFKDALKTLHNAEAGAYTAKEKVEYEAATRREDVRRQTYMRSRLNAFNRKEYINDDASQLYPESSGAVVTFQTLPSVDLNTTMKPSRSLPPPESPICPPRKKMKI